MELGGLKASPIGLGAWQAGSKAWLVDKAELIIGGPSSSA